MSQMFEKTAEINNTGMAQMMKGVSALSKTNQTAGIEMADFAKESLAAGAETMKKLAAARTPQAAMEIQGAYLKASFERLQAQAKVMSDLYKGLAEDIGVPLQGASFDPKSLFDAKSLFDMKAFFDPKNLFDPKNFPKLPGLPAMTAPKLAA
jgi:hypothetical protein